MQFGGRRKFLKSDEFLIEVSASSSQSVMHAATNPKDYHIHVKLLDSYGNSYPSTANRESGKSRFKKSISANHCNKSRFSFELQNSLLRAIKKRQTKSNLGR